jgi:hypothetical protein
MYRAQNFVKEKDDIFLRAFEIGRDLKFFVMLYYNFMDLTLS